MKTEKKSEGKKVLKSESMIAVIRIEGGVKVKPSVKNTLYRMRLRRKYSCIVIDPKDKSMMGMIKKVKYAVAYGEIEKDTLIQLLKARGKTIDKKQFDAEEIAKELISGKKMEDLNLKPFFRLHPPRKGIKSKLQYPRGVLGDNGKDINKLIERML